MSTSAEGLQQYLNKLATYCNKWKLQVNLKKTKVILFNRQGSLIRKHSFLFKSNDIEVTKQYKYLGFMSNNIEVTKQYKYLGFISNNIEVTKQYKYLGFKSNNIEVTKQYKYLGFMSNNIEVTKQYKYLGFMSNNIEVTKQYKYLGFMSNNIEVTKQHKYLGFMSNNIEVTKQHKYLGFIFSYSGSTIARVTNLINKARKAWFSIKYYLSSSKNKNTNTYLTLFDTQIKPIILYACEAWADSIKGNIDDVTILTKNKLEIFQISIFKQILGVSRKTINLAILLDLGRYPISTYMHYQAIKYFSRLSSINSERLLYEAYNLEKQKLQTGETVILNYITNVLNKIGMSNVCIDQIEHDRNNLLEKPVIAKSILIRFNDVFSQTALAHIQNTNKLTFLKSLKEVYKSEKYLKCNNFGNRRAITKLRTSNHTLTIEAGRWTNIERENRLCKMRFIFFSSGQSIRLNVKRLLKQSKLKQTLTCLTTKLKLKT